MVFFGTRCKDRPERNVINRQSPCCAGLVDGVGGIADDSFFSEHRPGLCRRQIILPQMNPRRSNRNGNIDTVINYQWNSRGSGYCCGGHCRTVKFTGRGFFFTDLYQAGSAGDQSLNLFGMREP